MMICGKRSNEKRSPQNLLKRIAQLSSGVDGYAKALEPAFGIPATVEGAGVRIPGEGLSSLGWGRK